MVDMDITGLPPGFTIDLADDNSTEFFATGPDHRRPATWIFSRNSDGGVLGGLPFPGVWTITVDGAASLKGITTWGWVRDDARAFRWT